jgi:type 1 fimbria pilin
MKRVRATVGAVLCAMVVILVSAGANAHAAGGRITFTGSVVNATCAPAAVQTPAQTVPQHLRSRCTGSSMPATYTLRVEPAAGALPGSQLITYQDSYLQRAGSSAWLATQVYD